MAPREPGVLRSTGEVVFETPHQLRQIDSVEAYNERFFGIFVR